MKKIVSATLLALFAVSAMAAEVTFEGQGLNGRKGQADASAAVVTVKGNVTKGLDADVKFEGVKTDGTQALSNKLEAGLTGSYQLYGPVSGYLRGALGEELTGQASTGNFGYYSVEPGVKAPIGSTGLTASLGWRFRDAFGNNSHEFTSRTWRAGLGYDVTKVDTVGVRYDRQRGDTGQNANILAVNYTRGF